MTNNHYHKFNKIEIEIKSYNFDTMQTEIVNKRLAIESLVCIKCNFCFCGCGNGNNLILSREIKDFDNNIKLINNDNWCIFSDEEYIIKQIIE